MRWRTDPPSRFSLPSAMNGCKPPNSGERSEYLIDGFRVAFLHQAEWQCACREFSSAGTCRHVREAAGMREAQALIQRRLRARVSDFLPYMRGQPVRRVGAQPRRPPTGGGSELRAWRLPRKLPLSA
jgi:hypothetical protein